MQSKGALIDNSKQISANGLWPARSGSAGEVKLPGGSTLVELGHSALETLLSVSSG